MKGPTSLVSPPEGTLIQAQQTLLTTITQLDPAYVNFTFTDSRAAPALQEIDKSPRGAVQFQERQGRAAVRRWRGLPATGTVDTRSRTVDPTTGTILTRAIFPNRDGGLLPGQFVRVKMTGIIMPNAIVIPKIAISQGPLGPFVYLVETDNVARARQVRLSRELPDGYIVRKGLAVGRPHRGRRRDPRPAGQCRQTRCPFKPPAKADAPAAGQAVISKFFIDRPVFAAVLVDHHRAGGPGGDARPADRAVPGDRAAAGHGLGDLSRRHAPRRSPRTVAAPIEQQINGVERMLYMQSTSTGSRHDAASRSPSRSAPTPTRRHQRQQPRAARPAALAERGRAATACRCRSARPRSCWSSRMSSPDNRYDTLYISNYALVNVLDELKRLPGVGDAALFGASDYSMRIWLRPDKLAQLRPHAGRRRRRGARAERSSSPPAASASSRRRTAAELHLHGDDARAACSTPERVREHHPARRRRTAARCG